MNLLFEGGFRQKNSLLAEAHPPDLVSQDRRYRADRIRPGAVDQDVVIVLAGAGMNQTR